MYGNFIYFILVLLIYLTYQPPEDPTFSGLESLFLFGGLSLAFAGLTLIMFRRIERQMTRVGFARLDQLFHATQLRSSILAVAIFALDIYALNLPSHVNHLPLFNRWPTLQAFVFLLLFMGYLGIVWGCAYNAYRKLYHPQFTRGEYIGSNISFSAPILLPWLLLSGIADLIQALPLPGVKALLATTEGQTVYFCSFLAVVAVAGPLMIKTFWRCRSMPPGHQRERIEQLCRRAGMAYNDILYWPLFGGKMITAGVMGLIRRFRYILVTPALLSLLAPQEIDAVIGHEIGHIKKKHLLFYLLFFAGYLVLSYVTFDVTVYAMIFVEPAWRLVHRSGANPGMVTSIVFSAMIICVFLVYFRYVFGFFMRNFERQADGYVFSLFDSAAALISTFHKISLTSGQPADRPNWHHFSIRERIDFLRKCEQDRSWIRRHDTRVRRAIGLYLAGLALLAAFGYQLNMGSMGAKLGDHLIAAVILREIERAPENPSLYGLLGDLYYRRQNFVEVKQAYEKSLALRPDQPQVLNNLAWLLATCTDEGLRDPPRALELAQRAAQLEQSAFILDTLAESYFANANYGQAVEVGRRALALASGDRSHYEAQLRKFMEAAEARYRGTG
ncbi:MAG: M48 family metalloprotease [Desulfobacterales bacterium]|nr:M48 family metalloprotease [Desulfobacterales bacterium]